jgi:hypothetical protein
MIKRKKYILLNTYIFFNATVRLCSVIQSVRGATSHSMSRRRNKLYVYYVKKRNRLKHDSDTSLAAAANWQNVFYAEKKQYFRKLLTHQTWLDDSVRYLLACNTRYWKLTETALTTRGRSTAEYSSMLTFLSVERKNRRFTDSSFVSRSSVMRPVNLASEQHVLKTCRL